MKNKIKNNNIFLNGMYGMVIGDAMGVPFEFSKREWLKEEPCTEMVGYGNYMFVPAGYWSDDTSMALATLDSIVSSKNEIDLDDIMNKFVQWRDNGKYACDEYVFDIGNTCETAIDNYKISKDPFSCGCTTEDSNGNGSLMRILPVCLYATYKHIENNDFLNRCLRMIYQVSDLTHNTARCRLACGLYFFIIVSILTSKAKLKDKISEGVQAGFSYYDKGEYSLDLYYYDRLRDMNSFIKLGEDSIQSTGYVVDTLEAAIWCLCNTNTYEDCILKAVNLGGDTDTIAAVAGGLAGLEYSVDGIPFAWKFALYDSKCIDELCDSAFKRYMIKTGGAI